MLIVFVDEVLEEKPNVVVLDEEDPSDNIVAGINVSKLLEEQKEPKKTTIPPQANTFMVLGMILNA